MHRKQTKRRARWQVCHDCGARYGDVWVYHRHVALGHSAPRLGIRAKARSLLSGGARGEA
jgi:hypothetical protein